MQTLIYQDKRNVITLFEGRPGHSQKLFFIDNVMEVKIKDGVYEVIIQDKFTNLLPILRVPVSNTNMIISRDDEINK
jgi:hypothetical protein